MIRLVAFDLDGTVVRGATVCEVIGRALGHLDRMRELEAIHETRRDRESLRALREELAAYYRHATPAVLRASLSGLCLAPGAHEAFQLLRGHAIETAIVTITWEFAAEWLGRGLGADLWVGVRLGDDGAIEHFWPDDKARWLGNLMAARGLARDEVAAVGDSWRDLDMLRTAGHPFYVGATPPPDLDVVHVPDGDLLDIARRIVAPAVAVR